MAKVQAFDEFTRAYDDWFDQNPLVFESELLAVKSLLPQPGESLEIGVGTGRFAVPLGIDFGVEPSINMCRLAKKRGVTTVRGVGEAIPFRDAQFDSALMVTAVCFLDNIARTLTETYRILRPGGYLVVGFIDKDSSLGQVYQQHKDESPFYRIATFYTAGEVKRLLDQAGFRNVTFVQTIFRNLSEITEPEPVRPGHGAGSFVVARGLK